MTIHEVSKRYFDRYYEVDMFNVPKKLDSTHVFDENLSVKQNRELVEQFNQTVEEERKRLMQQVHEKNAEFRRDILAAIVQDYNVTPEVAMIIQAFCYEKEHSCMNDYFCYIHDYAEFAEDIIKAMSNASAAGGAND